MENSWNNQCRFIVEIMSTFSRNIPVCFRLKWLIIPLLTTKQAFPRLIRGNIRCIHARPHFRKDQFPLDRFAISVPARSLLLCDIVYQDGNISGPKGPLDTRANGGTSEGQNHYLQRKCVFGALPLASTQLLQQKSFDHGTSGGCK